MGLGIGKLVNNALDKVLPDAVGDVVGAAVDLATGNIPGAIRNGVDLLEDAAEWAGADGLSDALSLGLAVYDGVAGGDGQALSVLQSFRDGDLLGEFVGDGFGVLPDALEGLDVGGPLVETLVDAVVDAVADEAGELVEDVAEAAVGVVTGDRAAEAGASPAGSGSATGSLLDMMANPEAMLDLYDRDPAAFQAAFREVPDNMKASVMQVIQSQMQENNQVAQLMSNLMSAEHQTAKAVIGNIRV